jgi:hypothetical protein
MSDWTCSDCRWVNRDHSTVCLSCGAGREEPGRGGVVAGRSEPDTRFTPALATTGGGTVARPANSAQPGGWAALLFRGGFAGGLAAGVIAAVLASAVWYAVVAFSDYQIGFVAILVGWLIGTAVVIGSRRRISLPLIAASGLLTLAALAVSEYLIVYHLVTQDLAIELELILPPEAIAEIVAESLSLEPMTLLFWVFALGAAVSIPFRVMSEHAAAERAALLPPGELAP